MSLVVTVFDRMPAPNAAIERYGALLAGQLNEAVVVPCRQVNVGDWAPEENKCHHNVATWIERNPHHGHVLGWLVIAAPNSDFVRFVAHSVVEDEMGNRFDITPLHAIEPRPFLDAGIDADDYFWIEEQLFEVYPMSGFDHFI
ncbi:hypothetical protein LJR131_004482 [Polaromonas sp. LjRoot131]